MRIALISDVHANMPALEAVLGDARAAGAQQFLCAGDVIGFGPHAKAVVDAVRSLCQLVVMGNHDNALARGIDSRCDPSLAGLAAAAEANARTELEGSDFAWLRSLGQEDSLYLEGHQLYVTHGAPSDPLFKGVKPDADPDYLSLEFSTVYSDYIVLGHTHLPMVLQGVVEGATVINPGSVGFPMDGDPKASYCLMDTENGAVHPRRIPYEIERTLADLSSFPDTEASLAAAILKNGRRP
jgi:putative phosphoesterase